MSKDISRGEKTSALYGEAEADDLHGEEGEQCLQRRLVRRPVAR